MRSAIILWFVIGLGLLLAFVQFARILHRIIRRMMRGQAAARAEVEKQIGQRCTCGYPIDQLQVIRCPECGRVFHFNATAEELGLSVEELHLAAERRRLRVQELSARPPALIPRPKVGDPEDASEADE